MSEREGVQMPDVYATISEADAATQERLATILEPRAADAQQRAMLDAYLSQIELGPAARVLEIGCGTGAVSRIVAGRPGVADVVGIDPSPVFVAKARELAPAHTSLAYEEGDWRALRFPDEDFDAVVVHTTLCHIPQPDRVLAEAFRVLRRGGTLAICDGDYSTITVALGEFDPLQDCIEAVKAAFSNDIWLVRRPAHPAARSRVRAARYTELRLPADRPARIHADARRPRRRHARRKGARRARALRRAQGRGQASGGRRSVLRLHRLHELHRPQAGIALHVLGVGQCAATDRRDHLGEGARAVRFD
jgi:SAM-dependent methyltransferase